MKPHDNKKVLNIEDTALKHVAITRALNKSGVPFVEWAKNGDLGIEMVEKSIEEGKVYDFKAGIKVIQELQSRNINIPIVVCSSVRYNVRGTVDCIFL